MAANQLSTKGQRVELVERTVLVISAIVGVASFLTESVSKFTGIVPAGIAENIPILAAMVLLGGPLIQTTIIKNPSSRYKDFAKYIGGYEDKVSQIMSDVKSDRQYERLMEVLALAEDNLNHVRVEWPEIMKKVDKDFNK